MILLRSRGPHCVIRRTPLKAEPRLARGPGRAGTRADLVGITIGKVDNFAIRIEDRNASPNWDSIIAKLRSAPEDQMVASVDSRTLAQLKFLTCLPDDLATKELESRLSDSRSCAQLVGQPAGIVVQTQGGAAAI